MKSNIQEKLGKRIQKLRKLKGFSQDEFAEKINIATTTLSSIETGKAFMTSQTLDRIINVLGVTPHELFTFSEDASQEDIYNYVIRHIELIKNDKERMKILYNVLAGIC